MFGLKLLLSRLGRRSCRCRCAGLRARRGRGAAGRRPPRTRGAAELRPSRSRAAASAGSTPGAGTTSSTRTAGPSPRPPAPATASAEAPTASAELAAGTPIHPRNLGLALGQAGLERCVPRPLVANPHVIELQFPFHFAPSGRQQIAMPACGRLAQLVGVRDLHEQALNPNFLVLGHGAQGNRHLDPARGAHEPKMSTRSMLTGSWSWAKVQDRGSRSARHRTNWVVCLKRGPSMWS
jgi:hypothetical protein